MQTKTDVRAFKTLSKHDFITKHTFAKKEEGNKQRKQNQKNSKYISNKCISKL